MFQFRKMISCATGRSFWAYLPYGCYCGLGGSGIPVDDTDRYSAASLSRSLGLWRNKGQGVSSRGQGIEQGGLPLPVIACLTSLIPVPHLFSITFYPALPLIII